MSSDRQQLLRVLVAATCADAGVDDPQLVRELAAALEPVVAVGVLRDVSERIAALGNSPAAFAIERLLVPGESLRATARRCGVKPSALAMAEKRLKRSLGWNCEHPGKASDTVPPDECND